MNLALSTLCVARRIRKNIRACENVFYVIIHKLLLYCPCRGHVDRSRRRLNDYIWNRNRATAGTYTMSLSYGHAAVRLIDPMITSGTATGPRQGHIQCHYHMVMPRSG